ncbi:Psmd14, partial [Symbiodinium microadriaticum]
MIKHGRAGVPMEVMGLMLGQFVDEYTITCVDVFAMPQAVDPVFQTKMLDMLMQTGRPEMVAAVVIDPIQSVKGKVVIDAFRLIGGQGGMMGMAMAPTEPRQTTSNIGFLKKPTIQARIHGLDRHYYSLVIDWRKNDLEEQILQNLNKKDWTAGLLVKKFEDHQKMTETMLADMAQLSKTYSERIREEDGRTPEEVEVMNVGKVDPKKHLE